METLKIIQCSNISLEIIIDLYKIKQRQNRQKLCNRSEDIDI